MAHRWIHWELTTMNLQEQSQAAEASPAVPAHVVQEHVKPQWPHSSSAALLQYAPICIDGVRCLSVLHACVRRRFINAQCFFARSPATA